MKLRQRPVLVTCCILFLVGLGRADHNITTQPSGPGGLPSGETPHTTLLPLEGSLKVLILF